MTNTDAQHLIDYISNSRLRPNDKPIIESVKRVIASGGKISKGQADWLNDIYRRSSGFGKYQRKVFIQ